MTARFTTSDETDLRNSAFGNRILMKRRILSGMLKEYGKLMYVDWWAVVKGDDGDEMRWRRRDGSRVVGKTQQGRYDVILHSRSSSG